MIDSQEPIRITSVAFYCDGERPPHNHPRVYYVFSYRDREIVCAYCGAIYEFVGNEEELG